MVSFARLIESALKTRTQEELAVALVCSQQAISDYRTGKTVPTDSKIRHYAKVLKVSEEKLRKSVTCERAARREISGPNKILAGPSETDRAEAQP